MKNTKPKFKTGDTVRFLWPQTGQWYAGTVWNLKGLFKTDNGPEYAYGVKTGAGRHFSGVAESRLQLLSVPVDSEKVTK